MDASLYLRAVFSLIFVIGLMLVLFWLVRRFDILKFKAFGGARRLGLVETFALDSRRRLVLIRRDTVEHLLVLGPAGETLIETITSVPLPAITREYE
jgi:flagellar protein FliO/FliZ